MQHAKERMSNHRKVKRWAAFFSQCSAFLLYNLDLCLNLTSNVTYFFIGTGDIKQSQLRDTERETDLGLLQTVMSSMDKLGELEKNWVEAV